MSFSPKYQEVKSSYIRKIGTTQTSVECQLPASDNTNIVKVVCANAKCVPSSYNITDKNLEYTGFVNFQVIYQSDDLATYSLDYSVEYKDNYSLDNYAFEPQMDCSVVDVSTVIVGNEIKVIATIETTINGIFETTTQALVGVEDQTTFYQSEDVEYRNYLGKIDEKFDCIHDFEIKDDVSRVLSVCPMVNLDRVEVCDGYVKIFGGILVTINYYTTGEKATVRSYQNYIPMEQEIAKDGLSKDDYVLSSLYLAINQIGITSTINTDQTIVSLELPVMYQGYAFHCYKLSVVKDLFSITNPLLTTTSSVMTIDKVSNESFSERIDGSIKLENMPFIDEVLGTCCHQVTLANAYVEDHELIIQGIATTTVLYYCKEDHSTNSVVVEIPFSITNSVDHMTDMSQIQLTLSDLSVKSKRGEEIEVFAKVNVYANLYDEGNFAVLSNVEVGEPYIQNGYALSVYFVKDGETLWEIAKDMKVSPDDILEQNPTVELPVKAGDKLYIYRQKEYLQNL